MLVVALVAGSVGGCGQQPAAPPAKPAAPEAKPAAPSAKDVSVIVGQREPGFLNPNYNTDLMSYYVVNSILSRLVVVNREFDIVPDLAESWTLAPDGLKYTFALRKNIKWHDGKLLTSADVKWSIESVINEKGVAASRLGDIDRVATPNDTTVEIYLKKANAVLLSALGGYYGVYILPKHLYDGTDVRKNEYNWEPVGTGPYIFSKWQKGSHTTLKANPDYFLGRPQIDTLIFKFVDSIPTIIAAMESGEMHTSQLTVDFGEVARLKLNPNLVVTMQPAVNPVWMGFNLTKKPYNDLKVRQAIAHAIDRDAVSKIVYKGLAPAEHTAWCSTVPWANNPNALQPAFDRKKAEQLLDEAGYKKGKDGIRFTTTISAFRGTGLWGMPETAEFLCEQLKAVGIRTTVSLMDNATWTEKVQNRGEFELAIAGGLRGPDPSDFAVFVGKGGSRNCMRYVNLRVEELFAAGLKEGDRSKRVNIYFELQSIIARELPLLNLVSNTNPRVHRKELGGFEWDLAVAKKATDHCFYYVYPVKK
jgi:peptide/nickel transport system substrate-binding protein